MAMMGKFAYHVTIRNVASAVYAKIFESINDHWGTKLNRKIQARYFWNNVLKMDDAEEEMLKKINIQ